MLKTHLSAVLFACLASLSVMASAAESNRVEASPAVATQSAAVEIGKVNLNSADAAALESGLIGIGKVKAQAIIDHRTANGPFASVDELLEVKGIGAATLEKNRDKLSIN